MKLPNKPRSGQKTIAALYRSICQVIDYLPSLTVKGDGKNIKVTNKDSGSIISVKNNNLSNWKYKGDYQKYIFGRGVKSEYDEEMCSGLDGIPKELLPQFVTLNLSGDGTYISASIPSSITDPVIISYIGPVPSGGGGSGGVVYTAGSGISISGTTIQTTFQPGCDIWFWDHSSDESSPGNYITIENGLSAGFGIKFKDNNPQGDYHMHYIGVDLVGGDYISIVTGTTTGGTPVNYPTIRCNLSATGYIGLSTVYLNQNDTGAIITTNLHGDGTTVTIDNDGTIHSHCSGGGGGSYSAGSGISISSDVIQTTFQPGYSIWFWNHEAEDDEPAYITIENGLSAGFGITYRDNDTVNGDYNKKYIDVNLHGGDYISIVTGTSTANGATVTNNYPTIRCNLSATGYLGISSVTVDGTDTGAILTTNLHGDGTSVIIDNDGTIHSYCSGGGGGGGQTLSAASGINIFTSGGTDYIETTFRPGVDIYFWDHQNVITIQNGLSAGHGISYRDNNQEGDYHQHYIDVDISGGQWLYYNKDQATMSCTLTGDNTTVTISNTGVISSNVWQYNSGYGISVDNNNHTITLTASVTPGSVYQGDNVTIAASGTNNNIFYVIDGVFAPLTTVVNLSTELSDYIDYVSSHFPLSTSELVNDVPFVTSTDLDAYYKVSAFNAVGDHLQYVPRLGRLNCTLTGGDWIQIDEQDNINCTLTNVSDLNNDAGYITTVDIPPSTTYIGTSGIAIEPILDENQQPTTSSNIYISASFYNTLTNPTNNTILSCNGGNLCWVQNTGGSTPTPTPGGNTSQFALTSGAFSAEVNSEMIILTPTHIGNYDYPFKFWGFDQNNNFACGDEYPPSAVTAIDTWLNMTLTGSMFGYWNTSYQADVAIVLPNPTGPCTVKVKGFGSTWVAIVSNGKKIFSDITYYNPETFDNFANYPDETFEVSYYIDYMDCYNEYKQYLYLYVNSATGWAYNPNFYEHMVSAINQDGGCWIRTEIK